MNAAKLILNICNLEFLSHEIFKNSLKAVNIVTGYLLLQSEYI